MRENTEGTPGNARDRAVNKPTITELVSLLGDWRCLLVSFT